VSSSFAEAIRNARTHGCLPVIADIKPVSPRDGSLLRGRAPADLARTLESAGACALSVVTAQEHFGGNLAVLREVADAVDLPILRKDFFSHPDQVNESVSAGARAVLLTLCTLSPDLTTKLYERVCALGIDAVVEIHTQEELKRALALKPAIVGINNRDLLQLETDDGDVAVTEGLAPLVPPGILTISESSLLAPADVARALGAGADAVLVGTALLQAPDPSARIRELVGATGQPHPGETSS
jgi:indole-3-glycerol phosphate synthase